MAQISISRRRWGELVMGAVGGLTAPAILAARAQAAPQRRRSTAAIFVQLGGGIAQHESWDPKPEAPAEYRGSFSTIGTRVPGMFFCELMPRLAAIADKLAVVRSIAHHEASHIALHVVETGYFLVNNANSLAGEMPAVGSIVARVRGPGPDGLPAWVALPKAFAYSGAHYLGGQYGAFNINEDPNTAGFQVANLARLPSLSEARIGERLRLRTELDAMANLADPRGDARAIDEFVNRAAELVTSPHVRAAFDLSGESSVVREQYGRTTLGQRLLLARRLVEAGVPLVTVRTGNWDYHEHLDRRMRETAPDLDRAMAALIADLGERGMNRDVLVIAMGEFGRSPRINTREGRDHWPGVASALIAGGNYGMGQAIGATDARGATVVAGRYAPQSVLAMVYRHLGVDPEQTFIDHAGRPRYVLEERWPIGELGG